MEQSAISHSQLVSRNWSRSMVQPRRVNSVANDDAGCLEVANDAEVVDAPRLL